MRLSELQIDPTVAETAVRVTDTRGPDPAGHYQLLLPQGFAPVDLPPKTPNNEESPIRVALFQTLEEPFAELEITGLFLRREVAPADVLEGLLGPNRTVVESRRVPSKGGDLLDALTRQVGDVPSLARWWTVKDGGANGGRLYVLEARTRAEHYEALAPQLATMLASFRLLNPTDWAFNEKLQQLSRTTPNELVMFYPASWMLQEVSDGSDGPFVANLWQDVGGRLVGRIMVRSEAGEGSVDEAIERYAQTLGGPVDWAPLEDASPFAGLDRAWLRRGRTAVDGAIADVRVEVAQGKGGTLLFGLAGMAAREDTLMAATLRRALEVMKEHTRVAAPRG